MDIYLLIIIVFLAFICEFIDCSLGMGYGTLMSPILLILGFDIFLIVPSILFSQIITGFSASLFHHKFNNCNLKIREKNFRIVFILTSLGIIATIISVFIALSLPKSIIITYTSLLVLIIGFILLVKKKFKYTPGTLELFGILSAFNKSLSGGGFGPIVTAGQVISGRNTKESIGVAITAEFAISIVGFIMYTILNGPINFLLPFILTISGVLATPLGTFSTKKIKSEEKARMLIGIICILLGVLMLVKILI
ncbi:MAG: sulfite exporter TauE/SafE family protein [Promethearchaeota archaeon]